MGIRVFPSSRSSAMAVWRSSLSPQRPRPPLTVLKWSSRRDNRRAYMTNFNDGAAGTLSIYDISRTPRAIATIPTGGEGSAGAAISADGQILYVAHMTSGDVTAFRIGNDRTPTRLGSWSAGRGTFVVALSPDGRRLWAANALSNDIAAFRVQADGRLALSGHRLRPAATVRGASWSHRTGEACRTLRRWRSPRSGCRVPRGSLRHARSARATGPYGR